MLRAEIALFLLPEEGLFLASLQRVRAEAQSIEQETPVPRMPVNLVNQEAPIA